MRVEKEIDMRPYVNPDYQICPQCGSSEVHMTDRSGLVERCVLYLWGITPYLCRSCCKRFYRRPLMHGPTQTKTV